MEAVEELKTLVEDWKGHRIEGFGELLLYGQYTVLKGDGMGGKNEERDVSLPSCICHAHPGILVVTIC
jgi:cell division control protein 24